MLELYQRIVLLRDFPQYHLQAGDVATLIDYAPAPAHSPDNPGYVLEIFNAVGESLDVVTVPTSAVEPLRADEMPAVRPLTRAA